MFSEKTFSQWDKVLYMDSKTNVLQPITETFFQNIDSMGLLLANPDAWPTFPHDWTIGAQLSRGCNDSEKLYSELNRTFQVESQDYFQSTVVLFDTKILTSSSILELCALYHKWGVLADSDQIIFSLYWNDLKKVYKPLPYRVYGNSGSSSKYTIPYDFYARMTGPYVLTAHRVP
jgi:hypothetical protein